MDALDTVFDEEESSVFKSEENLAVPTRLHRKGLHGGGKGQ